MTLLGVPLTVFLPVFAREVFKQGPTTYTLLLVCSGTGSVAGAVIVAAIGKVQRQGRAMLIILAMFGGLIIAFCSAKTLPVACVILFCCGAALLASFSLVATLVQNITTDDMRGRVMSVYNVAFRGGMPVGSLLLGYLVPRFGVQTTISWAGGMLSLVALYFLLVHRRISNI